MYKSYISIITGVALTVLSQACSLDVTYENQFSDPDAISTPEAGRELLANAYNSLPSPELDLALLTDDLEPTYWASRNPSLNNQYNWQPQPLLDLSASLWPEYYSVIVTINTLIERIPSITVLNDKDRKAVDDLRAEAATLKAYCYFQLLRLFSADPSQGLDKEGIVLKDKVAMENLSRASIGDCITEIRRLLDEAASYGHQGTDVSWLTADATRLLRAEVELYAGNYTEAASYAGDLLEEHGYSTFSSNVYRNLWDGTQCDERIFVYNNPDVSSGFYQSIVYDTSSGDYFSVNPSIAEKFGENDCRREWTLFEFDSPSLGTQIYIGKYNKMRKEKREIMLINKMRLSAALFVAAQAWCLDGVNSTKALDAVNKYLEERGAAPLASSLSGDELLKAILEQKQLEFLGEGERYFDLKHYRSTLLSASSSRIPAAGDYRWLMPIPKDEYLYNENMTQNPGWPQSSFD